MTRELTIRVFYPLSSGRIILRTELDWDVDVEPSAIHAEAMEFEFRVNVDRPFLYFKPCILDGAGPHWSKGANYLAIPGAPSGRSVYPHFFASDQGTISDVLSIQSAILGHEVRSRIYLPPGYGENTLKRYPVLYMLDGNNLFLSAESFLGDEWRVDETMDLLDAMSAIDKAIVVGIYPNDRFHEYTQEGYEAYGRFIVSELIPQLTAEFRLLSGSENTAVLGSSLGGVIAFFLAFQWPDVFGKAGCLSSTFTFRDDLMRRVADAPKRDTQIYLDSGWPGDNYEVTRCMRDTLVERGYIAGKDVLYLAFPGALHNEKAWAMRCHIPFQFFFGKSPAFMSR